MPHKGRFLHPTQRQLAISVGDQVHHAQHGTGIVRSEWGSWFSCRTCYAPIENYLAFCPHCQANATVKLHVTGPDIVDVEFRNGKTYAINKTWLKLETQILTRSLIRKIWAPLILRNPAQEHPDIRIT